MKKKNYIIVGDNNFWYMTIQKETRKSLEAELVALKKAIKRGDYTDQPSIPNKLFVYEANEIKTTKV